MSGNWKYRRGSMKLNERGDGCMGPCTRRHSTFAVCRQGSLRSTAGLSRSADFSAWHECVTMLWFQHRRDTAGASFRPRLPSFRITSGDDVLPGLQSLGLQKPDDCVRLRLFLLLGVGFVDLGDQEDPPPPSRCHTSPHRRHAPDRPFMSQPVECLRSSCPHPAGRWFKV